MSPPGFCNENTSIIQVDDEQPEMSQSPENANEHLKEFRRNLADMMTKHPNGLRVPELKAEWKTIHGEDLSQVPKKFGYTDVNLISFLHLPVLEDIIGGRPDKNGYLLIPKPNPNVEHTTYSIKETPTDPMTSLPSLASTSQVLSNHDLLSKSILLRDEVQTRRHPFSPPTTKDQESASDVQGASGNHFSHPLTSAASPSPELRPVDDNLENQWSTEPSAGFGFGQEGFGADQGFGFSQEGFGFGSTGFSDESAVHEPTSSTASKVQYTFPGDVDSTEEENETSNNATRLKSQMENGAPAQNHQTSAPKSAPTSRLPSNRASPAKSTISTKSTPASKDRYTTPGEGYYTDSDDEVEKRRSSGNGVANKAQALPPRENPSTIPGPSSTTSSNLSSRSKPAPFSNVAKLIAEMAMQDLARGQEEEARRKAAKEAEKRRNEVEAKQRQESEARRRAQEAESRRQKEREEARRQEADKAARQRAQQEAEKKKCEEMNQRRLEQEVAARRRQEEERRRQDGLQQEQMRPHTSIDNRNRAGEDQHVYNSRYFNDRRWKEIDHRASEEFRQNNGTSANFDEFIETPTPAGTNQAPSYPQNSRNDRPSVSNGQNAQSSRAPPREARFVDPPRSYDPNYTAASQGDHSRAPPTEHLQGYPSRTPIPPAPEYDNTYGYDQRQEETRALRSVSRRPSAHSRDQSRSRDEYVPRSRSRPRPATQVGYYNNESPMTRPMTQMDYYREPQNPVYDQRPRSRAYDGRDRNDMPYAPQPDPYVDCSIPISRMPSTTTLNHYPIPPVYPNAVYPQLAPSLGSIREGDVVFLNNRAFNIEARPQRLAMTITTVALLQDPRQYVSLNRVLGNVQSILGQSFYEPIDWMGFIRDQCPDLETSIDPVSRHVLVRYIR